jgi:hypothetical protein
VPLDLVDVNFCGDTFTAVMRPSGSGKTTLLDCAAGLHQPIARAALAGWNGPEGLSETTLTKLGRTRIGFVFEAFALVPALSVRDNILLPHRGPRTVARRGSSTVINESAAARIRWFLLGLWVSPSVAMTGESCAWAEEGASDGTDPAEPFSRMRRSRSATRTSAYRLAWAPGSRLRAGW